MRTWNGTRIFALALALLLCLSLLPTAAFAAEPDVQSIMEAYASGDQDALMSMFGFSEGGSDEDVNSQQPEPQELVEAEEQPKQPAAGEHSHVFLTYEPVKTPTCAEPGLEQAVCMVDGCEATDQHEIPALGHKFTERIPEEAYLKSETPEDCVHGGVYFLACSVCGASARETWQAEYDAVFTDVQLQYSQATKEEQDNTEYWAGLVAAGQAAVDAKYTFAVPPTGVHNMEYVEGQPATCTEDGYTAYQKCANCDYAEGYEVIPAAGHTLVTVEGQPATCTDDGYTAYQKCANCDYTEGYEVIPAAGHSFEAGVCTACGAEDPDYVAPVAEVAEATEPKVTEPEAEEPEAEEPQAEEPQAEEPQAEEPQAEEPQAEEPQAEEPQAEEPEAEEPQAEEPEAEEPQAEEPEAEEPKAEEPEAEEPKAEEPQAEEPQAEEPEAEEPKAEEPQAEEPKAEEPKAEAEPLDAIIPELDAEGRQSFTNFLTYGPLNSMPFDAFEVYDVTPVKANGEALTPNEAEARDDIVFTLPFPAGTSISSHSFRVFHGGVEGWEQIPSSYLSIDETGVTVTGWKEFSPFAVLAVNAPTDIQVTLSVEGGFGKYGRIALYTGVKENDVITAVCDPEVAGYRYRWIREDESGNEKEIVGASGSTYTLTSSDLNCGIICTVREPGSDKEAARSDVLPVRKEVPVLFDMRGHGKATYSVERVGKTDNEPITLPVNDTLPDTLLTKDKVTVTLVPDEGYRFRQIATATPGSDYWSPVRSINLDNTDTPYTFTVSSEVWILVQADREKLYIGETPTKGADDDLDKVKDKKDPNKTQILADLLNTFDSDVLYTYRYVTPIWMDDGIYMTAKEVQAVGGFDIELDKPNGAPEHAALQVYHYKDGNWNLLDDSMVDTSDPEKVKISKYMDFSPFCVIAVPSYTITFDANGGSGTMDPQGIQKGQSGTLNKNEFTRDGYVFLGWATKADGKVAYKDGASITPEKNMTLYAVWTNDTVTVTFDANGGSGTMEKQLVVKGEDTTLNSNKFSAPDGKGFGGWKLSKDGTSVDYADGDTVNLDADVTLYAHWARKVTVTINRNIDGSTEVKTFAAAAGSDYTLPENPFTVPDGKTFAGYSASTDGSVGFYKAGEKMHIDQDATEVVLYAIWGDDTPLAATVSLSGELVEMVTLTSGASRHTVIGDTLYASVSDLNAPIGTLMYQWIRTDGTSQTRLTEPAIGADTYTPTEADFGYRIFCVVTSTVRSGYRASSGVEIAVEYGAHDRILNDGDPNQNGYPGELIGALAGMSYSIDGGVWTEVPAGTVMNDGTGSAIVTRTVTKPGVYRFRGPAPTYKESSYTLTFKPWYSVAVNVTNPGYGTVRFNPDTAAGTHEKITGYENVRIVLKGQGEVVTLTPSSGYYAYYRVDGGDWISGVTRTTTGTGATATTTTTSVPVTITLSGIDRPHVIDVQFLAVGTSPRTGDTSNIGLWAALGFASFAGLVTLAGAERKRRKNRA